MKNPLGASSAASGKFSSTLGGSYNSGKPKKANDEIFEFFKAQSQPGKNLNLQQRAEMLLGIQSKETLKPE